MCSIPASPDYPVLNLGQAATVALYELRTLALAEAHHPDPHTRAEEPALAGLYDQFEGFLETIDHPEEKRAKTESIVPAVARTRPPHGPRGRDAPRRVSGGGVGDQAGARWGVGDVRE